MRLTYITPEGQYQTSMVISGEQLDGSGRVSQTPWEINDLLIPSLRFETAGGRGPVNERASQPSFTKGSE